MDNSYLMLKYFEKIDKSPPIRASRPKSGMKKSGKYRLFSFLFPKKTKKTVSFADFKYVAFCDNSVYSNDFS